MKKIAYLLSVYLFCLLPKLQAQDIDFPLSLSEIESMRAASAYKGFPLSPSPMRTLQNQDTTTSIFSSDKRDCA